jgi:uncharacterized protein (TIGR03435 family)
MPAAGVGVITGRRVTMLQFTETLQRLLDVSVLDQTALPGKYYFAFQYATEGTPARTAQRLSRDAGSRSRREDSR